MSTLTHEQSIPDFEASAKIVATLRHPEKIRINNKNYQITILQLLQS